MALDVYIERSCQTPFLGQGEYVTSFHEDEGDYWFLWPLFQNLKLQTGQDIDLYGTAFFGGADLDALEQTIKVARELTESRPNVWNVVIGQTGPPLEDILVPVNKQELLSLLDQLQIAVGKNRKRNHFLVFFGD